MWKSAASAGARRLTGCGMWWDAWNHPGDRRAPRKALKSCGDAYFEPIVDPAQFKDRDVVARAFADFYRTQQAEFPPECREADYEKRIKAAYPIHPGNFRPALHRLVHAGEIPAHARCVATDGGGDSQSVGKGRPNPLILPANISIDDPRVQFELTRYLSDNWVPVIEKDVDGPSSLPLRLDGEIPNLGKFAACRRVARAIYLGSAPTHGGSPPGHRRSTGETRLCHARRVAGGVWRCIAPLGRSGDLSLSGWAALLVLDPTHRDQTG